MKTTLKVIVAGAVAFAILLVTSCFLIPTPVQEVANAVAGMRSLIPGIQAGLALVKPDTPTSRALTPSTILTSGVTNPWTYGTWTPAQVYAAAGGSGGLVTFPPSGYYTMSNGDQITFTLTPETAMGADYYRLVLKTYLAFDMTVTYTTEEYIVNSAAVSPGWAWGNLDSAGNRDSWISLQTVYTDGTTGQRTVVWNSNQTPGSYYAAFAVTDPDPLVPGSFVGYRYEESQTPPTKVSGTINFSSDGTESLTGKGTAVGSTQYYTESTTTQHSGLTYVILDKKAKWSVDTKIVTRMQEDTTVATKKIRSVGEVGTTQYYIDKVDISRDASGKIVYTSTHDIYNTALPRGGDPKAKDYVALSVIEISAGSGTYTGTMEESYGSLKIVRDVTISRDAQNRFQVALKYKSWTSKALLPDQVEIPLTKTDLSAMSVSLPTVNGTFTGYYEGGNLFGTVTTPGVSYSVVVCDQGVAVNDVLYAF